MSIDSEDGGDAVATPLPLAATEPRHKQRFRITGYQGVWIRGADLSADPRRLANRAEPPDITRPRDAGSIVAVLGERLVEFTRAGSEI